MEIVEKLQQPTLPKEKNKIGKSPDCVSSKFTVESIENKLQDEGDCFAISPALTTFHR